MCTCIYVYIDMYRRRRPSWAGCRARPKGKGRIVSREMCAASDGPGLELVLHVRLYTYVPNSIYKYL